MRAVPAPPGEAGLPALHSDSTRDVTDGVVHATTASAAYAAATFSATTPRGDPDVQVEPRAVQKDRPSDAAHASQTPPKLVVEVDGIVGPTHSIELIQLLAPDDRKAFQCALPSYGHVVCDDRLE